MPAKPAKPAGPPPGPGWWRLNTKGDGWEAVTDAEATDLAAHGMAFDLVHAEPEPVTGQLF